MKVPDLDRLFHRLRCPAARWMATIAWSVWISVLLVQPEANPIIDLGIPSGPQTLAREIVFTSLHALAFGLTCMLWQWALSANLQWGASLVLACVIAIGLGAATEFLQSFAPDRYPSISDMLANCAGAFTAAYAIRRRKGHRQADSTDQTTTSGVL